MLLHVPPCSASMHCGGGGSFMWDNNSSVIPGLVRVFTLLIHRRITCNRNCYYCYVFDNVLRSIGMVCIHIDSIPFALSTFRAISVYIAYVIIIFTSRPPERFHVESLCTPTIRLTNV